MNARRCAATEEVDVTVTVDSTTPSGRLTEDRSEVIAVSGLTITVTSADGTLVEGSLTEQVQSTIDYGGGADPYQQLSARD